MAFKSVIDLDLNDEKFTKFNELFKKYRTAVDTLPAAWNAQFGEISETATAFGDMTAALLAQNALLASSSRNAGKMKNEAQSTGNIFRTMARDTTTVARNIGSATVSLLKWAGIAGALSGLIGGGGLYGIDRLALGAASARRSAQGLGTTSADEQAFSINYRPYVDPGSFLGNLAEVLNDPSKQYGLGGEAAALKQQGLSLGQIATQLLPKIREQFIASGQTVQGAQAFGLTNFNSIDELRRLVANGPEDLAQSQQGYNQDLRKFALDPGTQKGWQDFTIKLQEAGQTIENTLVAKLIPLASPLGHLSEAFTRLVASGLDRLGPEIEQFAHYLDSKEFKDDVRDFVETISKLTSAAVDFAHWLTGDSVKTASRTAEAAAAGGAAGLVVGGPAGAAIGAVGAGAASAGIQSLMKTPEGRSGLNAFLEILSGGKYGVPATTQNGSIKTNPLALRVPGSVKDFQRFGSVNEGVAAGYKQLLRYIDRDHIDTIRGIVTKYEGGAANPEHNNIAAYIRDVSQTTRIGADEHIPSSDIDKLAAILAAMSKHEGINPQSQGAVVKVLNQTGGSAVIITSSAAQP